MKSRLPKILHPLCGRPMLSYVIDAATEATGTRSLVVYSPATVAVVALIDSDSDSSACSPASRAAATARAIQGLPAAGSPCSMLNQPRR